MTTAFTLMDIASAGIVWILVSIPLGVLVGRWLARGSGQWLLDEWARED